MRARLDRMRWLLVPIGAYLAITLGLPAAHGAALRPEFWTHAGFVIAGCLAVFALVLAFDLVRWRKP